jgi:hypothetical protein
MVTPEMRLRDEAGRGRVLVERERARRRLKSVQTGSRMTVSDRWDLAFAHVPASSQYSPESLYRQR